MNFHQKIAVLVTFVIMTVTAAGAFLLGPTDPSYFFITKIAAIIFAELLCGISVISMQKMHKSTFLLNASSGWIDLGYLLFAVAMAFIPEALISLKNFVIIHVMVLLIVVLVMKLVYLSAFRDMGDQENRDQSIIAARQQLYQAMSAVYEAAKIAFPGNKEVLKKCQTLADNMRYASDTHCLAANVFTPLFQELQQAAAAKDETAFADLTEKLIMQDNLYRTRNNI